MKQSLARRKQLSQGVKVEPQPTTSTSHPGYAPDAALHAIKRHALEFVNPKELQVSTFVFYLFIIGSVIILFHFVNSRKIQQNKAHQMCLLLRPDLGLPPRIR